MHFLYNLFSCTFLHHAYLLPCVLLLHILMPLSTLSVPYFTLASILWSKALICLWPFTSDTFSALFMYSQLLYSAASQMQQKAEHRNEWKRDLVRIGCLGKATKGEKTWVKQPTWVCMWCGGGIRDRGENENIEILWLRGIHIFHFSWRTWCLEIRQSDLMALGGSASLGLWKWTEDDEEG